MRSSVEKTHSVQQEDYTPYVFLALTLPGIEGGLTGTINNIRKTLGTGI